MDERNRAELVQIEIDVEFVLFLLQSHFNGLVWCSLKSEHFTVSGEF